MPTEPVIVGLIPARYSSTRLPGKLLKEINGKPLIRYVWENVRGSRLSRVIIATDDRRIEEAVREFGGEVIMTSPDHKTGTDRIAEVAGKIEADIIVNIQGDEPLIRPEIVDQAVAPLAADKTLPMGTICSEISDENELHDPNVVKVVTDKNGFALYFSRFPIPFVRDNMKTLQGEGYYRHNKHIGLYVFRRDFLLLFSGLPSSPLERTEKLEQLRALENGYRIKVVTTHYESIGVDTPEDLEKVRNMFKQ